MGEIKMTKIEHLAINLANERKISYPKAKKIIEKKIKKNSLKKKKDFELFKKNIILLIQEYN